LNGSASGNPADIEADTSWQGSSGTPQGAPEFHLFAVQQVFLCGERIDRALRQLRAAQRSAADSLARSAASHERTAQSYLGAAEKSDRRAEYLQHAALHREFAQEDRRMADRLRRMAEGDPTGRPAPLPG
jgi:hypothetical protein